jgi:hypothetical protein
VILCRGKCNSGLCMSRKKIFIKNDISGGINLRGTRIHASIAFMVGAIARENTLFTPEF